MASATPAPSRLPGQFAAAEAAIRAVLEVAEHADEWDAATRADAIAWTAKRRDMLTALEGKVLTAEHAAGTWSLGGDRDLASFVGRQQHQGRGTGAALVAQAATLEALPAVAGALVDGSLTTRHLAEIAKATASSVRLAEQLATPRGQAHLVEMASRLDGAEFGKALKQEAASLDPAARQRSHDEQRANRSLAYTHTPGGTLIKGLLDSVAGHKFAKMVQALDPRPAVDDERTREQRRADALMVAVDRMLAEKESAGGTVAPVQALVVLSEETWTALRSAPTSAGSGDSPGSTPEAVAALRGVPAVVDERGQSWPASEVGRALCDCTLTRAVVGAGSVPLDLGRDRRLFKRTHWLALYAAGIRSCAVAGCGMPLAFTELHHVRWWHRHRGATDIANCIPYCSYHHHEVHRHGITATRLPDGGYEHRHPDGRRYGGEPPGSRTRGVEARSEAPPSADEKGPGVRGRSTPQTEFALFTT